jgi:ribosomal protein L11 methyltransferase
VDLDVRDANSALPAAADITIANILANPLRMLAPLLASHTRPGGRLALSGILRAQANDVMQAYAPFFDLAQAAAEAEWVCLAGTRRQAA